MAKQAEISPAQKGADFEKVAVILGSENVSEI